MRIAMLGTTLEVGAKYRLITKNTQQKFPRESVMTFLGLGGPSGRDYQFSARPLAGTQTYPEYLMQTVQSVERVSFKEAHVINRILRPANNGGN